MIRVTVELISAIDGHREVLGIAEICNDATGTPSRGNYDVDLYGRSRTGAPPRMWKRGRVERFPRKRLLAWDLVYRALHEILKDRR